MISPLTPALPFEGRGRGAGDVARTRFMAPKHARERKEATHEPTRSKNNDGLLSPTLSSRGGEGGAPARVDEVGG
jgi:hypothetical protein